MKHALKGYLIEKFGNMGAAYTCRRLVEEASRGGISLSLIGVRDCVVGPEGIVNRGTILEDCDCVINRYKCGMIKDAVNALGLRSYNPLGLFDRYVNKALQLPAVDASLLAIPDYRLATTDTPFDELVAALGLPFVAKGLESSMGREIFLISNRDDYQLLSTTFDSAKEFLFQRFVADSRGRDLRLFMIRGEAVAAMTRSASTDFRANVALGARVEKVAVNGRLSEIAAMIWCSTGLDFAGIDLLFGPDDYYFCELNVMPGLEGIEAASGVNVAGAIVSMINNDFR